MRRFHCRDVTEHADALIDGELGSKFIADVGAILADPARGLVWG